MKNWLKKEFDSPQKSFYSFSYLKRKMNLRGKIVGLMQKLKFSEIEIAFYMEVLKSPGNSIYELSRKLAIPKNKAYQIYGVLEMKGLVSSNSEGWKKKVVPTSLKSLACEIKKQSRNFGKIAERLEEVNKYLPFLNENLYTTSINQLSTEEAKEKYSDVLDEDFDYLLAYGGFDNFMEKMGFDLEKNFIIKRMKKGKFAKASLVGRREYTNYLLKNDEDQMRKCSVSEGEDIEKQFGEIFVNVLPQTNKTVVWSRNKNGDLEATVIESPQLAKVHEATFNYLWNRK